MEAKMKAIISVIVLLLVVIGNLFAQSTSGDSLFNTLQVHNIHINFSLPNYSSLLQNNKALDESNDTSTHITTSVIFDGQNLNSVGIQSKGNSSYYNYPTNKKPFTLSFNQNKPCVF
ncbi:MAG: hypothetical protein RL065_1269 [Bacteroidota bacterium]|jgi:spore coat protein CotH